MAAEACRIERSRSTSRRSASGITQALWPYSGRAIRSVLRPRRPPRSSASRRIRGRVPRPAARRRTGPRGAARPRKRSNRRPRRPCARESPRALLRLSPPILRVVAGLNRRSRAGPGPDRLPVHEDAPDQAEPGLGQQPVVGHLADHEDVAVVRRRRRLLEFADAVPRLTEGTGLLDDALRDADVRPLAGAPLPLGPAPRLAELAPHRHAAPVLGCLVRSRRRTALLVRQEVLAGQ